MGDKRQREAGMTLETPNLRSWKDVWWWILEKIRSVCQCTIFAEYV